MSTNTTHVNRLIIAKTSIDHVLGTLIDNLDNFQPGLGTLGCINEFSIMRALESTKEVRATLQRTLDIIISLDKNKTARSQQWNRKHTLANITANSRQS